uniref:Uncharacterized protein n=1 Tax=Ananas comosus var. bracteatus TaxID=296719 RepID=A0A6V7PLT3_ANACO|nr:unnamed protein product [Ananas comosus var. bracteatus]
MQRDHILCCIITRNTKARPVFGVYGENGDPVPPAERESFLLKSLLSAIALGGGSIIFLSIFKVVSNLLPELEIPKLTLRHALERELGEINKQLRNKLEAEGGAFRAIQGSWASDAIVSGNAFNMQHAQSSGMECELTLQIGYHQFVPPEATIPRTAEGENNFMLGWVL